MQFQGGCELLVLLCCVNVCFGTFELNMDGEELSKKASLQFVELFRKCVRSSPKFDNCVKNALNNAGDFYTTGVPGLNLPALDPWRLHDIRMEKTSYSLNLTNVKDSSWRDSTITGFKSSLKARGYVQMTQFCPELFVAGRYSMLNREYDTVQDGVWNFTLFDMHRTILITRDDLKPDTFRVKMSINKVSDVQLHMSDSKAEEFPEKDYLDNQFLTSFGMFGFPIVRPIVEDLLAFAYARKFSEIFGHFDWDRLFA